MHLHLPVALAHSHWVYIEMTIIPILYIGLSDAYVVYSKQTIWNSHLRYRKWYLIYVHIGSLIAKPRNFNFEHFELLILFQIFCRQIRPAACFCVEQLPVAIFSNIVFTAPGTVSKRSDHYDTALFHVVYNGLSIWLKWTRIPAVTW